MVPTMALRPLPERLRCRVTLRSVELAQAKEDVGHGLGHHVLFAHPQFPFAPGLAHLSHEASNPLVDETLEGDSRSPAQLDEEPGQSFDVGPVQPPHGQRVDPVKGPTLRRLINRAPDVRLVGRERIEKRLDLATA